MADKRATIVLTGEVQDAGFRGKVMRIAQKLELGGYIENLPNGTVRIICEGSEDAINNFVGKLDLHDDDIDVEDISLEWSDATGEFEWFEVKFDNLGMEMFQGFATAGKKLSDVSQKVDVVGQKVDGVSSDVRAMHTDLKEGFNSVEGAVSSMHTDMNTRFDTLDDKYGAISRQMNTLTVELQTSTKSLVALTEKIGALIDEKLAE